ncbi:hypothetical protein QFC21_004816 [Naganishia friedmannii]|uniref:Uncharacterized protein n=1 Tax=Naganishia friedmannii TaxID=89922 RepID=A0ACC2VCX4_9TREE|nr:hypothetical protein QFC21_004816 [Naganishia friedmannii]
MSFFGGASSQGTAAVPADMQARKEEMMDRIRQELAVANAQTLINEKWERVGVERKRSSGNDDLPRASREQVRVSVVLRLPIRRRADEPNRHHRFGASETL